MGSGRLNISSRFWDVILVISGGLTRNEERMLATRYPEQRLVYMPFPWLYEGDREFRHVRYYEKEMKKPWPECLAHFRANAEEIVFIGSPDDFRRIFNLVAVNGKKITVYFR